MGGSLRTVMELEGLTILTDKDDILAENVIEFLAEAGFIQFKCSI